ncbi:MAG TPA: C1 family peptidase [Chitinophagaceae bacterium]|nr:C1 family peptidase [Chitinophagaceae bacterium]
MRKFKTRLITAAVISIVLLFSCQKPVQSDGMQVTTNGGTVGLHNYGLMPMQPEQWSSVPAFSINVLGRGSGAPITTLPGSYLLASPLVRDQGQIGSCTGFCGVETNEILNYYKTNSSASAGLTVSNGLSAATTTQFVNSPLFGSASALSPLFIYYVERCIILKKSISSDGGAYMVNIPQTLQGLTNNTGTGKTLTGTINRKSYTFAGDCYENLYPYPSNGSNRSTQYRTAPSATAISNAVNFKIALQSGTTGSSGTTTHGYYVINSTDPVGDAKMAIVNKLPVMMGFNVYDNSSYTYFEGLGVPGYAPNNYTYNPLNSNGTLVSGLQLLGGHAVPLIGYIDDASQPGGGVFICENSWGTSWGYHGYFYLPYSVLKSTKIVAAGNLYVAII